MQYYKNIVVAVLLQTRIMLKLKEKGEMPFQDDRANSIKRWNNFIIKVTMLSNTITTA